MTYQKIISIDERAHLVLREDKDMLLLVWDAKTQTTRPRVGRWFVLELHVEGVPAGYSIVRIDESGAELESLFIAEAVRGRGYGVEMMRQAGLIWNDLWWISTPEAEGFYKKLVQSGIAHEIACGFRIAPE